MSLYRIDLYRRRTDVVLPEGRLRAFLARLCGLVGHFRMFLFHSGRPGGAGPWLCVRCGAHSLNGCNEVEARDAISNWLAKGSGGWP